MEENPNEKKSGGVLKVFIAIVLIALSIFALVKLIDCATQNNGQSPTNTDGATQLLSRSARRSDIRVENETTISLTKMRFNVIPNTDIQNLQVTITLMDESQNVLTSQVAIIGNVSEGTTYSFEISVNFLEILGTNYWQYDVSGGTVSYFA